MMCTIIYQDHASCFFSPIQVYELSGLIVCSSKHPYCVSVPSDDHDNGILLALPL